MNQIPTMNPGRSNGFRKLGVHDHACLLWETREELFDAVASYFSWGLIRGEKCLYMRDETPEDELMDALSIRGVNVREARYRDALLVIGKEEAYLKPGAFSPEWMISFLCRQEERVLEEGRFNGLRITGELSWVLAFEPEQGFDALRVYEARLNDEVFPHRKVAALCQYDMNRFPSETLIDAIHTHPFVVYRGTVCRNFYYIPSRDFLGQDRPRLRLARLLQNTWDRQRQEDVLRDNEAFASNLLEDSPNPILVTDASGAVRYANPALQKLTGYGEKELLGRKPPFPWWPQEDREALSAELKEAMRRGARKVRERFQKRNGDVFYVEITSTPVFKDDIFRYYLANWVDVTAREQYEEQLRIMRAAMDSAVSGMALADMDLTLFYVNPAWLRLWGFERVEEVVGLSALGFWRDRDQARALGRLAVDREEASATLEGVRRDGTTFMASASASIVKDDAGRTRCVMCSFIDVTDQIAAERILRQNAQRVNALLEVSRLNGESDDRVGELLLRRGAELSDSAQAFLALFHSDGTLREMTSWKQEAVSAGSREERVGAHAGPDRGWWERAIFSDPHWTANSAEELRGRDLEGQEAPFERALFLPVRDQGRPVAAALFADKAGDYDREDLQQLLLLREGMWEHLQKQRAKREADRRARQLEEANTALKVLIEFRDREKGRIQENVLANVNRLILPYLERLTRGPLNAEQRTVLEMVESHLRDLTSPFAARLSAPGLGVSPREAEVAALVREGKTSDEIGDILCISRNSAIFHRQNLRRKLGLRGKKVSLRTFLLEMDD